MDGQVVGGTRTHLVSVGKYDGLVTWRESLEYRTGKYSTL